MNLYVVFSILFTSLLITKNNEYMDIYGHVNGTDISIYCGTNQKQEYHINWIESQQERDFD